VPVAIYRQEATPVDYARVAWRMKIALIASALVGGIVFYGAAFLIPPTYRASATLIPIGQSNPLAALGGIGILGAGLEGLGLRPSSSGEDPAMYGDIVSSRRILEQLLPASFTKDAAGRPVPLIEILEPAGSGEERTQKALKKLRQSVSVDLDRRTGLLRIQARAHDRNVASGVANMLCDLLQNFILHSLTTQAGENGKFIDERIADSQAELQRAEADIQVFRERNIRIGNSPRLEIEEGRLARAVRTQEEIYLTLQRQRELTRLEERKDVPVLSVLDPAVPPIKRDWPKRSLLALLGALLGCCGYFAWHLGRTGPGVFGPERTAA
jgi:uncharacterized protein involved in exopolysaccharide biosynthesis